MTFDQKWNLKFEPNISDDAISEWCDIRAYSGFAVHCQLKGDLVGTLRVVATNFPPDDPASPWSVVSDALDDVSAPGAAMFNVGQAQFAYYRVAFTWVSGSGEIVCVHHAKVGS